MMIWQRSRRAGAGGATARGRGRGVRAAALVAAWALASTSALGAVVPAQAEETGLVPGPTVVEDPASPTGYTGHFVYHDPEATSVRFVADILLRDWEDPSDPTVYSPDEYRPGLMRGGGAYDAEMTDAGNGYWVIDVPLAAGANQYWFYVDDDTDHWVTDPANPPRYAPDGLSGTARRAFNKVNVPYDPQKQDYAPLAAREIENPRPDVPHGRWSYVPFDVDGAERTLGVYLPPGYDPDRAEPYRTIYMQHGGGQDQSDWMNIGSVPVIMDNLIADGLTEPAVAVTANADYLGGLGSGSPNLRDVVLPFVESTFNVSTRASDRAFAGLSMGSLVTQDIVNHDPTLFGYYGPWSGGVRVDGTTPDLEAPYILYGGGAWDFGLPDPDAVDALDRAVVENVVVAGAHDFNAWNQLFTTFARDYLWKPQAFLADELDGLADDVAHSDLNPGGRRSLTVKLDRAFDLLDRDTAGALEVLRGFTAQVDGLARAGRLTGAEADRLLGPAEKVVRNLELRQDLEVPAP